MYKTPRPQHEWPVRAPRERVKRPARRREVPETLHHITGFAMLASAHLVARRFVNLLVKYDLTINEFMVLAVVQASPDIRGTLVAERIGVSKQRANVIVRSLEKRGLVERIDQNARRLRPQPVTIKPICLTRMGADVFGRARVALEKSDDDWQAGLKEDERDAFRSIMLRIAPNWSALRRQWWLPDSQRFPPEPSDR